MSSEAVDVPTVVESKDSTWSNYVLVSIGSVGLFAVVCGTFYLLYRFFHRKVNKSNKAKNHQNEDREDQQSIGDEVTEMEIPPHEYQIYPDVVLGQGKFSIVLKGKILIDDVAVKIPKRNTSVKQTLPQQLNEIEILKVLIGHKNIVGILGVSSKLIAKGYIYQFLEVYPLGSLDKYLKDNREKFSNLVVADELQIIRNKVDFAGFMSGTASTNETFNTKTLISWAYQICDAMEYISGKNIVHGDLAARNVLIQSLDNIKISDFGLSRRMNSLENIVQNEQFWGTDEDAIPWRWLSYETVDKGMISVTSDVWSYGVTLWEIFSLGEVPYAGLEWNSDFLNKLQGGLRLQSPRYSTTEMYKSFMDPCWALDFEDRPSFLTIKANISHCIQNIFSSGYEEVNNSNSARSNEEQTLEIEVIE